MVFTGNKSSETILGSHACRFDKLENFAITFWKKPTFTKRVFREGSRYIYVLPNLDLWSWYNNVKGNYIIKFEWEPIVALALVTWIIHVFVHLKCINAHLQKENSLKIYTANVYRGLQGDYGVFLQYLQGKPCNIYIL